MPNMKLRMWIGISVVFCTFLAFAIDSVEELKIRVSHQDADAAYALGCKYYYGDEVEKDYQSAIPLFENAIKWGKEPALPNQYLAEIKTKSGDGDNSSNKKDGGNPDLTPEKPSTSEEIATDEDVGVISTSLGVMVVGFYPDVAPKHVDNFKKLARQGFYDGQCFHRVIKGFMIQGGDPNTKDEAKKDTWGQSGPGYTINAEFNGKHHERGVLSMARAQDPNSAGSQFFICHGDCGQLDGHYTVFGYLIKGWDVLDKIAETPTEGPDRPVERVDIWSIRIASANESSGAAPQKTSVVTASGGGTSLAESYADTQGANNTKISTDAIGDSKNTNQNQKDLKAIEIVVDQFNKACVAFTNSVAEIEKNPLKAGLTSAVSDTVVKYGDDLREIDISDCPLDFRIAFVKYYQAVHSLKNYADSVTGWRGVMNGAVNGIGALFKLQNNTDKAVDPLEKAGNELMLVCTKYGIQIK